MKILQVNVRIIDFLSRITRSIAFLPTLLIIAFLVVALLLIQLENWGLTAWASQYMRAIVIKNEDTARIILSTTVSGLFSLVVFTFSMVMLLLNQASNSFSPRLLPGLISDKRHQVVLGFFIGTIVFGMVTIFNILPDSNNYQVPGVTLFLYILLSLACLGLFIYFLHSISQSVQVSHMLNRIYERTKKEILEEKQRKRDWLESAGDYSAWHYHSSPSTGYLQSISKKSLLKQAHQCECTIRVVVPKGTFVVKGTSVLASEKEMKEEQVEAALACLHYHVEEVIDLDYIVGFKRITEIILKAMSPGINDPATAITGIDYLVDLFRLRLQLPDAEVITEAEKEGGVIFPHHSFESLLYSTLGSLRLYIKHDTQVVLRLLNLFRVLLKGPNLNEERKVIIKKELQALQEDVFRSVENDRDEEKIKEVLSTVPD